jgi:transcriptional regulator with XRE-family HTH domain
MKPSLPTSAQLKAARQLLGCTQPEVGRQLGRTKALVSDAELRPHKRPEAAERLKAFYEASGIEFLPDGKVGLRPSRSESEAQR